MRVRGDLLQECGDDRRLTRLFEQKRIVPIIRLDQMMLDLLVIGAQRGFEITRVLRWIEPIRRKRNEQVTRRNVGQRTLQRSRAAVTGEVKVGQRARAVEVTI